MTNPHFIALGACQDDDRLLVYNSQRILCRQGSFEWRVAELTEYLGTAHTPMFLDRRGGIRYLAVHVDTGFPLPDKAEFIPLRQLLFEFRDREFAIPGLGNQLTDWFRSHRYCGYCGNPTEPHPGERALKCPSCQQSWYPRINPCVIVLVTDGARMLLARHSRYKGGYFSCLAGFVEVGETPEQTVAREVKEEAGIEIDNIRYVRSQSWPFPSQLMLGYFADFVAGELCPEPGEIEELKWFYPQQLPSVPSAGISVAGKLIQLHCEIIGAARNAVNLNAPG